MTTVCAWCDRVLVAGVVGGPVTHGICPACLAAVSPRKPWSLRELLENLSEPVLCLGGRGELLAANPAAERAIGRDLSAAMGILGGDLFECRFAGLPGGCGRTVHCAVCSVRRTVEDVAATGHAVADRRAWIERAAADGTVRRLDLLVSAEKVGEVVLLRIDRMGEAGG
jgi:PAS domain-containing protein